MYNLNRNCIIGPNIDISLSHIIYQIVSLLTITRIEGNIQQFNSEIINFAKQPIYQQNKYKIDLTKLDFNFTKVIIFSGIIPDTNIALMLLYYFLNSNYQLPQKMGTSMTCFCQFSCWDSNSYNKMSTASKFAQKKEKKMQSSNSTLKLNLNLQESTHSTNRQIFLIDDESSFCADNSNGEVSQQATFVQIANCFYKKGNFQAAINNYMIALHKVQRKDIRMADIHFAIGQCYFRLGNFRIALKHCKMSQSKYTELAGKMSNGVAMASNLIGHIQSQVNDYVLAQHYYQKAYQIYHQQINLNRQNLLELGFNLGALYINIGHDYKALDIYEQMETLIKQDRRLVSDSIILELYRCLGVNCFKLKLYERCMLYFRRAFSLYITKRLARNNQIDNLIISYQMIMNYILTVPMLNKSKATLLTRKIFEELNHRNEVNL